MKQIINKLSSLIILIFLLFVYGCGNSHLVKAYSGPTLPENKIAILLLHIYDGRPMSCIRYYRFRGLDGMKYPLSTNIWKIELLPGLHTIKLGYHILCGSNDYHSESDLQLSFHVNPGRIYMVFPNDDVDQHFKSCFGDFCINKSMDQQKYKWKPTIEDITDNPLYTEREILRKILKSRENMYDLTVEHPF